MTRAFGPYPATVINVHDGDTITVDLDLGFDLRLKYNCRVFGINAPELSTTAGKAARDFAQTLLAPGDQVNVISYGWDKYGGRFDGMIMFGQGRNFATEMMAAKHAVPLK